jgi:hypothetical protein
MMKPYRAVLSILFLLCACLLPARALAAPPSSGQTPVSIQATFDRGHATVGDPIGLTIMIRYPRGAQIDTTGIETQFKPFEVLSVSHPARQAGPSGATELRLGYQVAAYQTGPLQLPALTIPYTLDGQAATAQSQALSLTIDSVIPPGDPGTDIRPLKAQLDLPGAGALSPWAVLSAAVAALAIALLAFLLWRRARRRGPAAATPAPSLVPLEQQAHAELDELTRAGLMERGQYGEHYARLAQCIRRYIARRYGFPANALTTTELADRMEWSGVGRWRARLVADLLEECDAVHYAYYLPAPARAQADMQRAHEIVDLNLSQETRGDHADLEVGAR